MVERLFSLYWLEGADIGASDVLIRAAVDVGLDGTLVAQFLGSEADLDPVIAEINQATEIGITGVPTFILAGKYAIVGAQSAEVLRDAIRRISTADAGVATRYLNRAPGFQALVDRFLGCSWRQTVANQMQFYSERFDI